MDKLPPFNEEAEQAVLTAILLDNNRLFSVLDILHPSDFYKPRHAKILYAMCQLNQDGNVIDLMTLSDELEKRKQLDEIGGAAYLVQLVDIVPTAANVEYHAKIVKEKSLFRQALNIGLTLTASAYEAADPFEVVLSNACQSLLSLTDQRMRTQVTSLSTGIRQAFERFEAYREQMNAPSDAVFTGFPDIDNIIMGFQPGNLIVVAARPGCGKTAFACDLLRKATQRKDVDGVVKNVPVSAVLYSLEMTQEELSDRILCAEAKVNKYTVKTGTLQAEHWERLTLAAEVLDKKPSHIVDPSSMTIAALRAHAKRMMLEHHIGMILIDYAQLVLPSSAKENRVQEVSEVSRGLKALAKELHLPVVALAQLNREVEKRNDKRPQLADLRETGQLEQDSDIVMFPFRPELYFDDAEKGLAEMIIAKHRDGALGAPRLRFFAEHACFENYSRREDSYPCSPQYEEL